MRAVTVPTPGGPEALILAELPDPEPRAGEVVIDVVSTAVNRADLLQRRGLYPPPPGASEVLGLECAGSVRSVGHDVTGWSVGDEVCALLAGGGYAEQVAVPAAQLMRVPVGVPLDVAGALPEVACTVWSNVFMIANLQPGETLLVHGGAGGIGTFAIQLGVALGAHVYATAGSADKLELCRSLGAERAINYKSEDFVGAVKQATEGRGADVILDMVAGDYIPRDVDALAVDGRIVVIALQRGAKAEVNLLPLMQRRLWITGSTLRPRSVAEKGAIARALREKVWPLLEAGRCKPVIDSTFALARADDAHRRMESGEHVGKIVLTVRG